MKTPGHFSAAINTQEVSRRTYVMAGNVGGVAPQLGRDGWSWYTDATAWTWFLAVEEILGIHLVGGKLRLAPCLSTAWREAEVTLTRLTGSLHIRIGNPEGLIDGAPWTFPNNASVWQVDVRFGAPVEDAGETGSPAPPSDSFAK